jgi:hypothetical protein
LREVDGIQSSLNRLSESLRGAHFKEAKRVLREISSAMRTTRAPMSPAGAVAGERKAFRVTIAGASVKNLCLKLLALALPDHAVADPGGNYVVDAVALRSRNSP